MPKHLIGHDVIVIYDHDFEYFKDMIQNTFFLNKVHDTRVTNVENELAEFKNDVLSRMAFVERFLASTFDTQGKKNSATQPEQESSHSEAK